MESPILLLNDLRPTDLPRVGAKAAQLGILGAAGFPVPSGMCVTASAFQSAIAPYRDTLSALLSRPGLSDADTAQEASEEIANALSGLSIPPEIAAEIREALKVVAEGDALVAVRSSATAEDRADVSFAGQYETILGVRGEDAVLEAILACWRSFFSPNALVARADANALGVEESMAVLVQRMVDAECSGVAFSVDPVHPESKLLVVNAAWGLGPGVVDGRVATDLYRVKRSDLRTEERQISEKSQRVALNEFGEELLQEVPEDRRRAACLPDEWLRRIAQFTIAAENLLGGPQDVEWAVAEDRVWILQSRPVTGLPSDFSFGAAFPLSEEDRTGPMWELNGSSRSRVPLPLVLDLEAIRESAWAETMIHNGGMWGNRRNLTRRKVVNGRAYTQSYPSDLHDGDARIRKNASADLGRRLREMGVTPWEHVAPEVMAATERLAAFDRDTDDGAALAEYLEDALGAYRRHWMLHFAMPNKDAFSEPFFDAFMKLSGHPREGVSDATYRYLEGAGNMLTRLVDGLYRLGVAARGTSAAPLILTEDVDAVEKLKGQPDAAPFLEELHAFLKVYGDRSGLSADSEPAIRVPTWRENPALIFPMIAPYLNEDVEAPEALRERMNWERERTVEELCSASEDAEAAAEFRRWLPLMRRGRTDLENHNHYIDQLAVGQLRTALMAAGRWLTGRGLLPGWEEVFWLRREEIADALRAESAPSLAEIVSRRKAEREAGERMTPPPILGVPDAHMEPRPPVKDEVTAEAEPDGGPLRGHGASAGRYRGRARVIPPGAVHPEILPGEVMVAEYAGPAWTPTFPILGGLVLEHANMFQHAATTAREYGVPAVINAKDATKRIPDGAWVTLDGSTGEIVVEEDGPGD